MSKRAAGKVPFGWDAHEILACILIVRKLLQRTRGHRYTVPTSVESIKWHTTSRSTPWISGHSRNHVWLRRDCDQYQHAIGFLAALTGGVLREDERAALMEHFPITVLHFSKAKPKPKRKRAQPTTGARLLAIQDRIAEWEAKLKAATRAMKLAKTKLRSLNASERAFTKMIATTPIAQADDATFTAHVRRAREAGVVKETHA